MHFFEYQDGELWAEGVKVSDLAAAYGTPLYIYSASTFRRHYEAFDTAFKSVKHLTCFSVKSNSNLCVLRLLGKQGAGMDIVSGGELFRALKAGIPARRIVYSGVGKRNEEIMEALLAGILMFNVESVEELLNINRIAGDLNKKANVSLRINPDVDPKTHPYISTGMKNNKFGLDIDKALETYALAKSLPHVDPIGIDCHIGSQLTQIEPFIEALRKLKEFHAKLTDMGLTIQYLDLGGGLGITYNEEQPPLPGVFGQAIIDELQCLDLTLILEPGRVISGNSGILVTSVIYNKATPIKKFVIVDAAMNDLIRPALYQSFHRIAEVKPQHRPPITVDVVGPICESSDFLAKDRLLPQVQSGELLAVFSTGAYGFVMSSQYNSRGRAAEIFVDGDDHIVARRRETYADLIALEKACMD